MEDLIVWVADVGSISKKRFGWCRATSDSIEHGGQINEFADGIAKDLSANKKVALGFEYPLFVPISDNPVLLTSARYGEGVRAWCAGAGCGALAVGLTESVWIFQQLKCACGTTIVPTFEWDKFNDGYGNVFIWEAFVSGAAKAGSHSGDAVIAANTFWSSYPNINQANSVTADNPYSLIGAALLRSGLSSDMSLLSKPCIVLKS